MTDNNKWITIKSDKDKKSTRDWEKPSAEEAVTQQMVDVMNQAKKKESKWITKKSKKDKKWITKKSKWITKKSDELRPSNDKKFIGDLDVDYLP